MSEQGWKEFLAAEDLDDWVVLHGGATAAFRVASLAEAAGPATAIDASGAPAAWILADRAGNKVCVAAWPDGAAKPVPPGAALMALAGPYVARRSVSPAWLRRQRRRAATLPGVPAR